MLKMESSANLFKNAIDKAQTASASLTANDTTVTVVSSLNFTVNDYIKIDEEILKITAVNSNDVTVLRGQLSTAATSHPAGSSITLIEPQADASTINEGTTYGAADTTLTVTSAPALNVAINSYIIIENEILQVSAINGNNLTVTRGLLGTTATTHADATTVTKLIVTAAATTINETTITGITPPLIKNLNYY
jgi:hypothetical protein